MANNVAVERAEEAELQRKNSLFAVLVFKSVPRFRRFVLPR
jgi:hypothetical protein